MFRRLSNFRQIITSLAICFLLSACQPGGQTTRQSSIDPILELQEAAASLYALGEYSNAAAAYHQLQQLDPDTVGHWQLREADAWLQAGDHQAAAQVLSNFDSSALDESQSAYWQLLRAEHAFLIGDITVARSLLENLQTSLAQTPDLLGRTQLQRWQNLLSQLTSQDNQQVNQLLDQLLANDNSRNAFSRLASLPGSLLLKAEAADRSLQASSWLEAAQQARRSSLSSTFNLLDETEARNILFSPTQQRAITEFSQQIKMPARVAILLPESDNLAGASTAIRKGLLASWLQLPLNRRPELHFFDTGNTTDSAIGAYFSAAEQGVDWIIGPLQRNSVAAIRDLPTRTIPILFLNQPSATSVKTEAAEIDYLDHFVFALPPEDEARTAARQMISDGQERAVVIAPQSRIGERLSGAFIDTFEQLGGQVIQQQSYNVDELELTELLSTTLNLHASRARHQNLQNRLGLELAYRQRTTIDAIFLAGDSKHAQLILPQLKFIDLDYIPVYATARVQSGIQSTTTRRDLERIRFATSAWLLGSAPAPSALSLAASDQSLSSPLTQALFGLGRDSLLLLPHLQMLRGENRFRLQAASGHLTIDDNGVVKRTLQPVQLLNGRLVLSR